MNRIKATKLIFWVAKWGKTEACLEEGIVCDTKKSALDWASSKNGYARIFRCEDSDDGRRLNTCVVYTKDPLKASENFIR